MQNQIILFNFLEKEKCLAKFMTNTKSANKTSYYNVWYEHRFHSSTQVRLRYSFFWTDSPEGYSFWKTISKKYSSFLRNH